MKKIKRALKTNQYYLKDGHHHGCGGSITDPHGEEGGDTHEAQHNGGDCFTRQHQGPQSQSLVQT